MLITLVVLSLFSVLSSGQLQASSASLNLRVVEGTVKSYIHILLKSNALNIKFYLDLNSLKSSNNSLLNAVQTYESVNKNELSAFLTDIDINTLAALRKGIIVRLECFVFFTVETLL